MTPHTRSKLLRWLNPLRILCEFGIHRDDGLITNAYGHIHHCGRCFMPWRQR